MQTQWAINTTYHTTLKASLAQLVFGRDWELQIYFCLHVLSKVLSHFRQFHISYVRDQVFVESNRGLYLTDLNETGFLINTNAGLLKNNYRYFSRDYSKANWLEKIQRINGRPSTKISLT